MKGDDGAWSGITIELWNDIARELDLAYEFMEADLDEMVNGLQSGEFDAAVAALTMTADREAAFDFTHAFYESGLGIAVPTDGSGGRFAFLTRLFSVEFFQAVGALAVLLFVVGVVVWLCERRRNAEQFGGGVAKGMGSGFWWSAVTMTTVGYGDKAPVTFTGRLVALGWMFASIIVISSFTAAIASALTVSQLDAGIDGPEDLYRLNVATVADSTSQTYLESRNITVTPFPTPSDALRAVASGKVDAAVYDAPVMQYLLHRELEAPVHVLPRTFQPQDYAIALRTSSSLREPINRIILESTAKRSWRDLIARHLGE